MLQKLEDSEKQIFTIIENKETTNNINRFKSLCIITISFIFLSFTFFMLLLIIIGKYTKELLKTKEISSEIRKEGKYFTQEFRLLCTDQKYYWFKLNGTSVFNQNQQPNKFFGKLENVNQDVIKEQQLTHIAETDLLSGLINKGTFEQKVKNYIEKKSRFHLCVLHS